jgi:hypothetical protein
LTRGNRVEILAILVKKEGLILPLMTRVGWNKKIVVELSQQHLCPAKKQDGEDFIDR